MRKNRHLKAGLNAPRLLTACLVVIGLAAVASAALVAANRSATASGIGSVAVIITLLVLVLYTYYTRVYAWAAVFPSVSFVMRSPAKDHFQFLITNHSNVPVRCWCRLNPRYGEIPLTFAGSDGKSGFYEGGTPFDVLPHQTVNGAAFAMTTFFMREMNKLWNEIRMRVEAGEVPRMHFRIEFWYEAPDLRFRSAVIEQRYYYDFAIGKMVLDY